MPSDSDSWIAAGTQLAIQAGNMAAATSTNKATRKWNEKMYGVQRQDALSDWDRQNAYNHPSAIMARLRESGLNPALIYGKGAGDMSSGPVKGASVGSWNPKPPQFEGNPMATYFDTQIKTATLDNLRAQNTVLENEALLKLAQVKETSVRADKTASDAALSSFDLHYKEDTRSTAIQSLEAQLAKQKADTQFTLDQNERAKAMQTPNLQIAGETILNMRLQRSKTELEKLQIEQAIDALKTSNNIQQLELRRRQANIHPNDPFWWRLFNQMMSSLMIY